MALGDSSFFNNQSQFGDGGFPSFGEWMRMRYNPAPAYQPPQAPSLPNFDWDKIFNPEPKIRPSDKKKQEIADIFGINVEDYDDLMDEIKKRIPTKRLGGDILGKNDSARTLSQSAPVKNLSFQKGVMTDGGPRGFGGGSGSSLGGY